MMMTVISLAISLVSIQGFFALPQEESSSNQPPGNHWIQQENKDTTHPNVSPRVPPRTSVTPVGLPAGDNAWAVQILSRGGLIGSGRGDLTVASDGILIWSGPDGSCSRKLTDEAMQELAKVVLATNGSATPSESSFSVLCGDCYVTSMILRRRGNGDFSTSAVSWDDTSQAKISAEMLAVYEAAMAHRGCKL
jgi:hypothetical protein